MPRRLLTAAAASLLAALLVACSDGGEAGASSDAPPLSDESIRSLTVPSEVIASGEATLEDGSYQADVGSGGGASLASVTLTDTARGDLDGDGDEDVVAIIVESGGGSGSFYGLWAILNKDGEPVLGPTSVMLGDRIQVRTLAIGSDGVVSADLTVHGPDDPLCCPTLDATQRYRLEETLVAVEE